MTSTSNQLKTQVLFFARLEAYFTNFQAGIFYLLK